MSKQKRGLGGSLDALLPTDAQGGVRDVLIERIFPNSRQPRTHFDDVALSEFAASIREHGIIQPLIVRRAADERYELIAGERRWRAAQRAGLTHVPVMVRETSPQQLLELALIENVQRADLNPLEEAHAYQSLKDDFGLSDEQIAQRLGKGTRESIVNARRLLQLHPDAQAALVTNAISAGHGRALLKFKSPEEQQAALEIVIADELTVREAERLSDLAASLDGDLEQARTALRERRPARAEAGRSTSRATASKAPATLSPDDQDVQRTLERTLGTPVSFSRTAKEVRITISFHSEEKLQEFYDMLNGVYAR